MEIIEIKGGRESEAYLAANPGNSGAEFLLSEAWLELTARENKKIILLAVRKNGRLRALLGVERKDWPAGFSYWYAARGPLLAADVEQGEAVLISTALFSYVKNLDRRALFLKVEPANHDEAWWRGMLPETKCRFQLAAPLQPRLTLVLNLENSEAELLAAMHQKTRYNIRLAEKKGVKIVPGTAADFPDFWRLLQATSERDDFRLHGQGHYRHLFQAIGRGLISAYFAEYEGRKIAAALVATFAGKATYLHGASDNEYRQAMAPNLLQWEIIKAAKRAGCQSYDFYGIDAVKWPGVTRFKLGFGGEERRYPGVFDIIFRPAAYHFLSALKSFRQKLSR